MNPLIQGVSDELVEKIESGEIAEISEDDIFDALCKVYLAVKKYDSLNQKYGSIDSNDVEGHRLTVLLDLTYKALCLLRSGVTPLNKA